MAATLTVPQLLQSHKSLLPRLGVITLYGYGICVRVERGHLILEDGIGPDRRHGRFSPVGHGLKRLVVIGSDGTVTLSALRWLADQDASFVMLDRSGKVLVATGPVSSSDARLRRAQACAELYGVDIQIAHDLIGQKLLNQAKVAEERLLDSAASQQINICKEELAQTSTIESIRELESIAAKTYWQAWRNIPVTFLRSDLHRVPDHWKSFGTRISPLTNSPRLAVNPANAILNYLYAVLESEARLAVAAMGLDPGLGVLHRDIRLRDSLPCDLMEAVRPQVDAYVFDWISRGILHRNWFFEERDGNCRLMGECAQKFSETATMWARALAPVAEHVAKAFWATIQRKSSVRMPAARLTQNHRRFFRVSLMQTSPKNPEIPSLCRQCGKPIKQMHKYCQGCSTEVSKGHLIRAAQLGRIAAQAPEVRSRRGQKQSLHRRAELTWDPRVSQTG